MNRLIKYGISVLLAALTGPVAASPTWFSNQSALLTSLTQPGSQIVEGNIDGSGRLSIVVLNASNSSVGVLIANGDGTFKPEVLYTVAAGQNLAGLALADMNGDGKLDIVVGVENSGAQSPEVAVLLGNGDGTFKSPIMTTITTITDPINALAVGDVNGDGKADVITVNYNKVVVWYGNGDGTLSPAVGYVNTNNSNQAYNFVTTGAFGGAMGVDVVAGSASGTNVSVLLGYTGSTNLSVLSFFPNSGLSINYPSTVLFPGNAYPSLAFLQPVSGFTAPGSVQYFTGNGSGLNFSVLTPFPPGQPYLDAYALGGMSGAAGEVDAAECMEFATVAATGYQFTTDIADNLVVYGDTCAQGRTMLIGDFNGDGHQDVAFLTADQNHVAVALNNAPTGTNYFEGQSLVNGAQTSTPDVQFADVNHDGVLDAISEDTTNKVIWVSLGDGKGGFKAPVSYALANTPGVFAVGDVRGTGYPDIFVWLPNNYYEVLKNNGNGTFTPQPAVLSQFPNTNNGLATVIFADVDGSGKLAMIYDTNNGVRGQGANALVYVCPNTGNDTFGAPQNYSVQPPTNLLPVSVGPILSVDMSGKGYADLVVSTGQTFAVLLNQGNGTFGTQSAYSYGEQQPSGIAFGDINGDGLPDIVATYANSGSGYVVVWQNNGNGTFTQAQAISLGFAIGTGVAVASLNGDGINDILLTDASGLVVLKNNGLGSLAAPQTFPSFGAGNLTMADFNGDGHPDFAVINSINPIGVIGFRTTVNVFLTTTAKAPPLTGLFAPPSPSQPMANNGVLTTTENTEASGILTGKPAVGGDALTFNLVGLPPYAQHGTVTITNANTGAYTYDPAGNYSGTDSFMFTVTDVGTNQQSAPGTITVTISSASGGGGGGGGSGGGGTGGGGGGGGAIGFLTLDLLAGLLAVIRRRESAC